MDTQIFEIQKQIEALENTEEFENDALIIFNKIDDELSILLDMYYEHANESNYKEIKHMEMLKKRLKQIKNDADLYDDDTELDMMFPDGIPDEY